MSDERVEIYRLRTSQGTANSASGHWEYYEDLARFTDDLLEALIEAEGRNGYRGGKERSLWLSCRAWLTEILKKDTDGYGTNRVIGAEHLVDGVWVDVEPKLTPPDVRVTIRGEIHYG